MAQALRLVEQREAKRGKAGRAERLARYQQMEDRKALIGIYERRIETMRAEIRALQRRLNGA